MSANTFSQRAPGASGVRWRSYSLGVALLDAVAMSAAAFASGAALGLLGTDPLSTGASRVSNLALSIALVPAWLAVLALGGAYDRRHLGSGFEEYRRLLSSIARLLSVIAILALIANVDPSRPFVAMTLILTTAFTLVERYLVRRWLHRQRAQGRFLQSVLLVGNTNSARALARQVIQSPHTGLSITAACLADRSDGGIDVDGTWVPVLGRACDVLGVVQSSHIDAVLVTDQSTLNLETLRDLAWQVEGSGVTMFVAPEITDVAGPLVAIRPVPGLPILTVEQPELGGPLRVVKEAVDRVLAATCIVGLLPLLVVIALAVRVSSRGPVIFKQVRVGLRGKPFVLWKFRTMIADAEERRATLLDLNEHDGVLFKIRDDPRVTPLGKVLRRWSVDELPQLWNVMRGDMSIIGPRPPLPAEVENYSHRVRRRLLVKPGMTGLWQISGRSGIPWEEAVRLDLHYVEHWSPSLDMTILAKTVSAVLRRHGAY